MKNKEQLRKYAELLESLTNPMPSRRNDEEKMDEGTWNRLNEVVGSSLEVHRDALGYFRWKHKGLFAFSYGYKAVAEYFFILNEDAIAIMHMNPQDASSRIFEMIREHDELLAQRTKI